MSVAFAPTTNSRQDCRSTAPDLLIVGGGMAGFALCDRLVKRREADDAFFRISILGEEPQLAYDRVNISQVFSGKNLDSLRLASPDWYKANNVEFVTGRKAVRIDPDKRVVVDSENESHPYQKLVLATGSYPWLPPIEGIHSPGVFVYRTIDDLFALKNFVLENKAKSAAVIGGGLLGLEAAKVMLDLKVAPTVLEAAPGLMPRQLDAPGAKILKQRVEGVGVTVHTARRTRAIEHEAGKLRIQFHNAKPLETDLVIVAAGIRPRDELAKAAGITVGERGGFSIDSQLQTNVEDIFAIGECASFQDRTYGLVAPCYRMADVLADRLNGQNARFTGADESAELKLLGIPVVALGRPIDEAAAGVILSNECSDGYRKIILEQGRVTGAASVGEWPDIDMVRIAVGSHQRLWPHHRRRFVRKGRLSAATESLTIHQWPENATVCACLGVSRGQLGESLATATTAEDLAFATGAGTACGSCKHLLSELAGSSSEQTVAPGNRSLLWTSAAGLLLSVIVFVTPPLPMADSVQDSWRNIDALWRSNLAKQVSGYTLLAFTVVGLVFSLRKRIKVFNFGSYGAWRIAHTALGVATLVGVVIHTGFRLGANLNLLLSSTFLALAAVGGLAGITSSLEARSTGNRAMFLRSLRPKFTWLHILLFWPIPILIALHIFSVYWY